MRSIQAGFSEEEGKFPKQPHRALLPHPTPKHAAAGKEVSPESRKQDTARLSMAGFPGRQLGILCFLITSPQHPSAQCLAGALSGRPQGSAWFCPDPPRAPEQRAEQRGLTCGWGQGRPGTACWKSAARPPLGDDSFHFPSFRLLQAGITSGSPGMPCSLLPLLTALSLSWDSCPAAVSLQAAEWLGSPGLVAEGTVPTFAASASGAWNSQYPACFMLFRDCLSPRACHPCLPLSVCFQFIVPAFK